MIGRCAKRLVYVLGFIPASLLLCLVCCLFLLFFAFLTALRYILGYKTPTSIVWLTGFGDVPMQ